MRRLALFAVLLVSTVAANPLDRKSIFLDKMDGFEAFIEKAAAQQDLRLELLEEAEHPDLKVLLGKKFTSVHAEVIYKKQTGRNENSRLTVVDAKSQKSILTHDFNMGGSDESKQKAADQFVQKLKNAIR